MKYKHIFGPVPSRRLGISLGVDLVPYKTCNLNCVYCECGTTTLHTNKRDNYIDYIEVINELKDFLVKKPSLDYITFSGAGEPLLNLNIGKIINFIKSEFPQYKLALLTNGILLGKGDVLEEIINIDLLIPSLDAATEDIFYKINRPTKEVDFKSYINGLSLIRNSFKNQIWLEIFLIKDFNDTAEEIESLNKIIEKISPDKVQLNTIDRPPAVNNVKALNYEELIKIKNLIKGNVEIIKNFSGKKVKMKSSMDLIVNCLQRRPMTIDDLMDTTGLKINEINKILRELDADKLLIANKGERNIFYSLKNLK